jgi:predicted Zn-dependent peptidase
MTQVALRGTKTRSAQQILTAFEQAGGSIGANSGRNTVSFSASVLADDLPRTLPVFADVVLNPSFPADELENYRERTLAAIARADDRLFTSANRFFMSKFFPGHPYGRMTLGTKAAVEKLDGAKLAAFHDRIIAAPNGVLAIFGDIDLDRAEALAREQFAALPAPADFAMPDVTPPPAPAENQRFVKRFKQTEAAQVDVGFAGVRFTDPDYYPLMMLDTMISGYGLPGGWLHEELRGRQLVYVVHAVNITWTQAGCFWIYAQCQPGKASEVVAAINAQLDRARNGELTERMLADAKALVLARELLDNQTNEQLASRCALDEVLGRGYEHYLKLGERVRAVTLDDVRRVVDKYLTRSVTTITTGDPDAVR